MHQTRASETCSTSLKRIVTHHWLSKASFLSVNIVP